MTPFTASAVTTIGPPVAIDEVFNPAFGSGQFTVNNYFGADIYAFAVGNDAATFADGGARTLLPLQEIPQAVDVWDAAVISRSSWEAGNSGFGAGASASWTAPDTTQIAWDSLFPGFNQIVAYWVVDNPASITFNSNATSNPVSAGQTVSHFTFITQMPASPFATFGQGGTVTASGNTQVVPVPAAVLLFGSGLLGLAGIARRN